MKILHVLYSGLGGHGNVFFSMVNADVNKRSEYEALFFGIEDVRSDYIDLCNKNNIKFYFAKKNKIGFDRAYIRSILSYIKQSDPEIVFLHGSAYILPAKFAGISSKKRYKIIVRETQANHLKSKAQWITLIFAMALADKIVCLTKEFDNQLKKKLRFFYRKNKIVIIPNGLDLAMYKPIEQNAGEAREGVVFTMGMQSRIVIIKDHFTLLKAFAIVKSSEDISAKNLRLKIAGDGDIKDELIKFSEELGIKNDVEFTGMLNEESLVSFLQSLDLYIHASLGETMSTAIMQAMACGLPVIASDVSGINNMIVPSVTGILVPPKDEHLLAAAIKDCINKPLTRRSLAEKAHEFATDNFSNQAMLEAYNTKVFA